MRPEWEGRLNNWLATLEKEFYEPLGELALEGFCTYDLLDPDEAERQVFAPMPVGTAWGRTWEYCWLRGDIVLDERARGQKIVMDLRAGGEATLFVDGEVFGTRRAEWVHVPHHYICDQILTLDGQPGQRFHMLMEAYAGHDYPERSFNTCATGPVREGDYEPRDEQELRQVVGRSSWGIWHEEAYQLWLDATTLRDLLSVTDDTSLRAARIEEALEAFTLAVDFEQPREARLWDYVRARELLRPALEARNGSTMPRFAAVGNAHIDVCWLWPYRETQRKVARTFAQQLRLMELYPDYKFIQSQPQTYLICKQLYPRLYERVKGKIRAGQWIADGSMWVEPDTNMTSGESLIRQLIHGKRFYKEEFGVDCRLLWLPDTFGYSAALPQILKGCGVEHLTTQKIFWTYNGADRFPYHYFTWQGMDGSEITTFLHMDYTSRTDVATSNTPCANAIWRARPVWSLKRPRPSSRTAPGTARPPTATWASCTSSAIAAPTPARPPSSAATARVSWRCARRRCGRWLRRIASPIPATRWTAAGRACCSTSSTTSCRAAASPGCTRRRGSCTMKSSPMRNRSRIVPAAA